MAEGNVHASPEAQKRAVAAVALDWALASLQHAGRELDAAGAVSASVDVDGAILDAERAREKLTAEAAVDRMERGPTDGSPVRVCAGCGKPTRGHWCSDACRIAEDGLQDEDLVRAGIEIEEEQTDD